MVFLETLQTIPKHSFLNTSTSISPSSTIHSPPLPGGQQNVDKPKIIQLYLSLTFYRVRNSPMPHCCKEFAEKAGEYQAPAAGGLYPLSMRPTAQFEKD